MNGHPIRVGGMNSKITATAKATTKTTAGPSTPLLAKCASNFAQDDTSYLGSREGSDMGAALGMRAL